MKKIALSISACLMAASCSTTAAPPPPVAPAAPEKIGTAPSQPGNCFYRGPDGKVFIAAC